MKKIALSMAAIAMIAFASCGSKDKAEETNAEAATEAQVNA